MNLYVLDLDPFKAARSLCDGHILYGGPWVVQVLCAAEHIEGGGRGIGVPLCKPSPVPANHPCVEWAVSGINEWWWTAKYALALYSEHMVRYGRDPVHLEVLLALYTRGCPMSPDSLGEVTPQSFDRLMPAYYSGSDPVKAHRVFYLEEAPFAKWERPGAETPDWFHKTT